MKGALNQLFDTFIGNGILLNIFILLKIDVT